MGAVRVFKQTLFFLLTVGVFAWMVAFVASVLRIPGAVQWLMLTFVLAIVSSLLLSVWTLIAVLTDPWLSWPERKRVALVLVRSLTGFGTRPKQAWTYLRDRVYERDTRHWATVASG